jgi:hypothetical protein
MSWATRMRHARLALALVAASCGHEGAFTPTNYTPGQPAGSGSLVRLTFNPGQDLGPAWLPDGTGFLYTVERLDRSDRDRCLARMPAAGGSIEREICNLTAASRDSVDAYSAGAVSAAERLVYVRASAPIGFGWPLSPRRHDLVLATLADPRRVTVLESFPVAAPSGHDHDEAAQIRWLSDQALVYLAQSVKYVRPCQSCGMDTITIGVEIARLDLGGGAPALSILPGTDQASSFTTVGSDTVYFTVYGDSRVFRLTLGSGALDVAHDFGGGALPRDVQVAGNRLVAVVGGHVEFGVDSVLGPIARDRGGEVHVVDLPSGVDQIQPVTDMLFRHLALDSSGHIMIAEGYSIVVVPPDTTFSTVSDLWRFELP